MDLEILEKYVNDNLLDKSINIFIKKDDYSMDKYEGFHYDGNTVVKSCSILTSCSIKFLRIWFYIGSIHFDITEDLCNDDFKFIIN